MKYQILGTSGLRVSEFCLGTMTFGEEFKWGSSKEISEQVFNQFVDAGGNFFDTANYYTKGTSEKWLGEFIRERRKSSVIATKYTLSTDPSDQNASGNQRKNLFQAVEESLRRLQTDYIDLYWVHAWDPHTPIEETLRALNDLIKSGKVLYIGISNAPAWVVAKANTEAKLRGWSPFYALQLQYSLIERTIEPTFFPFAAEDNLSILAWSPLAMGVLSGKYHDKAPEKSRFNINPLWGERYLNARNLKIASTCVEIAKKRGMTPSQVALKWIQQKNPRIIPIVGAKNGAQLKESLEAFDAALTEEDMLILDEASCFDSPFPESFIQRKEIKAMVSSDAIKTF